MTVPLSAYRISSKTGKQEESKYHVDNIFLSSDERCEVYEVKAAEDLIDYTFVDHGDDKEINEDDTEASKDDDSSLASVPLIDGCDIPGWRKEKLLQCSS